MEVLIRYQVRPDQVEHNLDLLRDYFDELDALRPAGLRDAVFQLADGVGFVHLVKTEGHGAAPLPQLPAFQRYRAGLEQRCDEPPVMTEVRQIGSYQAP